MLWQNYYRCRPDWREECRNASQVLDEITSTPGSMLVRGTAGWMGLDPGPDNTVLSIVQRQPFWTNVVLAGPQGPSGPQGSPGVQGAQGPPGIQGPQGVAGGAVSATPPLALSSSGVLSINLSGYLPITGGTLTGTLNMSVGVYQYAGRNLAYIVPSGLGDNVFFGESGNTTLTGYSNVGNGPNAFSALTTGNSNVAAGVNALRLATTGANNVAIGTGALTTLLTGAQNVAIGTSALRSCTSSNNNAVGYTAAQSLTTGGNNNVFGFGALAAETTGSTNTVFGHFALNLQNGAGSNTVFGYQSGYEITTGGNNVFLGYFAGRGITTGSGNTVIGYNMSGLAAAQANAVILGSGGTQRYDFNVSTPNVHTFSAAVRLSRGYTVATLPAGGPIGTHAYVTDGAASLGWGVTVTGGGTTPYLVWYNGTAWTVVGH